MTAWLYAVVSSAAQEETLVDQERWARALCAANGWELERIFSAVTSGKHGVRKLLVQLVAELRATPKERRPARVLMVRLDRIGRGSIVESQVALREIAQLGATVHTRDGGDERIEGPMAELIAAAKFAVGAFENAVRREKSLAFHARKKAEGEFASTAPYGFVVIDKRLTPYEPEAAVIRTLFEQRAAGWGYQRLAVYLAPIAPGKLRPNGELRAIRWSTSGVRSMLLNPRYRGQIVAEALWDTVAALRGSFVDRRAPRWPWPLRGALRCTCGALLMGEASGREGHRTRYYVCRRITTHGGRYPHHNANRLEAQFVALLGRMVIEPPVIERQAQSQRLSALEARERALSHERSVIEQRRSRAWEVAEAGDVAPAHLAARLEEFDQERARLGSELARIERELVAARSQAREPLDIAALARSAIELWPRLPVDVQRDVARALGAYLGGFFCDPAHPHRLRIGVDGTGKTVDTVSRETSTLRLRAALRAARTVSRNGKRPTGSVADEALGEP